MKLSLAGFNEKYKIEICLINFIILLYLFRTAIPLLKFPFLALYSGFIVYSVINYRKRLLPALGEFIRTYYLILILTVILIISILISNKLYLTIFKDAVNMIIIISCFFLLNMFVTSRKGLSFFVSNLVYLIVIFAVVISLLQLLNQLAVFSYFDIAHNIKNVISSKEVPDEIDYNFALLPAFFGTISILILLRRHDFKFQKVVYNLILVIFSLSIILSGSRRGIILFLLLIAFLVIAKAVSLFRKNNIFYRAGLNTGIFLFLVAGIFVLISLFVFRTSFEFKTKTLQTLGSRNVVLAKYNIATTVFRYSTAINRNISFSELFWIIAFDPRDPDSGWGDRVHKTIAPLSGKNVEIVPPGSKGYLMDSTCIGSYYSSVDLCESYTMGVYLKVNQGDKCKASVYCYVSDSADINSAGYGVGSLCISQNMVTGKITSSYDLEKKGIWQKLEIEFTCKKGDIPIYLSFWKKGVSDFSKLKGYVIFAYPVYEKTTLKETLLQSVESEKNQVKNTDSQQPGIISSAKLLPVPGKFYYSGIFSFKMSDFFAQGTPQIDRDPIRESVSKLISEDTAYFPYKSNIVLDTISSQFLGDRLLRWEFAGQIFTKEYSLKQKLFGGGFNFLNWYGFYFLKDKTASDWPHNPFLSILLYSGIIGLIIYCIFLFMVFYYYIKYYKEYPLLFIFFLITFFFTFFSGGSPFDPPVFGFFSILPFFIHSVHKKSASNLPPEEK
jgi:hypothetical protein